MAIALATIRTGTYTSLFTLLTANKPTYTYNSGTLTYTIYSAYPQKNPSFPCIVINKAVIKNPLITMAGTTNDTEIEVTFDYYAKELHGIKAIEAGQDGTMNTIIGNIATFIATDKISPQEDFWSDGVVSPIEDNNQLINTSQSTVRFKLN